MLSCSRRRVAGVARADPVRRVRRMPEGAQCAAVTVPLDHSGATAGTLSLAYAKVPATGTRAGTIVPAQRRPRPGGGPADDGFADAARGRCASSYDIVTVDQRGTGESGAVDCTFERVDDVAACASAARRPARRSSTRPRPRSDLEDLRVALGVDKLTLLGVSYGAKVAGEYARRYPASTAALVLDSPDAGRRARRLRPAAHAGRPARAREVCFPGLCSGRCATPTPRWPRPRSGLQGGACAGRSSPGRAGSDRRVHRGGPLLGARASRPRPALRAGLPAAIASLAAGDAAPLLHLARARAGERGDAGDDVNTARLLATSCIEGRLPWAPDSAVASRADALRAFVAAAPTSSRRSRRRPCWRLEPRRPVRRVAADAAARGRGVPRPGRARCSCCPAATTCARRWRTRAARRRSTRTPGAGGAGRRPFGAELRPQRLRGARAWWRSCAGARWRSARAPRLAPVPGACRRRTRPPRSATCARRRLRAPRPHVLRGRRDPGGRRLRLRRSRRRAAGCPGCAPGYVRRRRGRSSTLHGVEWIAACASRAG